MAEVLQVASEVLGPLDYSIRTLTALKQTYSNHVEVQPLLERDCHELANLKTLLLEIQDQPTLQSANVRSDLVALKEAQVPLLGELRKVLCQNPRPSAQDFLDTLGCHSEETQTFGDFMKGLLFVKDELCRSMQYAYVGVFAPEQGRYLADMRTIDRVDRMLVEVQGGEEWRLKIAEFLKGRPVDDDGMVHLSQRDIDCFNGEGDYYTDDDFEKGGFTKREIIGNWTQEMAIMVNGPIGKASWDRVSHVIIKDNRATGSSMMFNGPMDPESLKHIIRSRPIIGYGRPDKRRDFQGKGSGGSKRV